jgi:hypothetical protein
MSTHLKFLARSVTAVAGALTSSMALRSQPTVASSVLEMVSLCGKWFFRTNPTIRVLSRIGTTQAPSKDWRSVNVPHTWWVEDPPTD